MRRLSALLLGLLITSFSGNVSAASFDVFVSILPQKYFVQKLGGEYVHVMVMVSPGASPATYEPRPGQMVALSRAKAYFSIGVPFARTWLTRIKGLYKGLPIIRTEKGIEKEPLFNAWAKGLLKGRKNPPASAHSGLDPHIWTSPALVMLQARTIMEGLSWVDPSHTADYEANYRRFIKELVDLDLEIRDTLLPRLRGKTFLVFHPSWGYFARTYGLRQIAIEREGRGPGPRYLEKLIGFARKNRVRAIFIQPQFSRKSAQIIAQAIGARVISADPLAEDWAQNLKDVAAALRNTLEQP